MDSFDIGTGDDDVPLISEATTDNRKKMTVRLLSGAIAIVFVVVVVSVVVSTSHHKEPTVECHGKWEYGVAYFGNDIKPCEENKKSTPGECQQLCRSVSGCVGWEWGHDGDNCCVKSKLENRLIKGEENKVAGTRNACPPDEVIFISGGVTTETSSELVDVAPSGAGCARVTGQLPDQRLDHSMDLLNGKLVICGGVYSSTSCIAASTPSGPWSAHSTTTGRREGHGSSTVGGVVHLIGGGDSASMERWEGDRWITKANPPVNFGWGTCATNVGDNTIVVIGGDGSNNKVARYRVEEDEWEELSEVPVGSGRKYHGCVYLGDGQVLVGGGDDESYVKLKSCGIYHIEEGRWEDVGDMNSARWGVRFVAVNVDGRRRFYALGGYDGSSLNSIEEFDRKTKTWGVSPVRMAEGRYLFDAVVLKKTNVC